MGKPQPKLPLICEQQIDAQERLIISKLLFLRHSFHISRTDLASALSISEQELQNYEEFHHPIPASLLVLASIALGVELDYFYQDPTILTHHEDNTSLLSIEGQNFTT